MQRPPAASTATDFDRLINPRSVAIVGASSNPTSIGGQPLRFLTEFGYQGKVYPVNPRYPELKGLACYPDIGVVPRPCDVALIAVGAAQVPKVIEQCGAAGIPFAIVMSAGFREIGAAGMGLQRELEAALARTTLRMVGPNCIGMMNVRDHIHCGFGGAMSNSRMRAGGLAMVTQSGGFGLGVVAAADQAGLGFNYVISTGNETDVGALELVAYLVERDDVEAVVAYLEGSTDGRRLRAIGERALEKRKPVLMWKVGNSGSGRRAAVSHTGRLTADATLFRRALADGGFIDIGDTDDLVDIAAMLRAGKLPRGRRVAILTLSGGAGVLLADLCEQHGLQVPVTSPQTVERLKPHAPDIASLGNPIDLTPQGYADGFASYNRLIAEVLAAGEFDQAIVRSAPGTVATVWAEGFVKVAAASDKPVVVTWGSGSERSQDAAAILERAALPCFLSPRRAVRALGAMHDFALKLERHRRRASGGFARPLPPQALDIAPGARALGEHRSKSLLAAYGVPVTREVLLSPEAVGALTDAPLAFPLAVKIESADLPHKTEAGAVKLGVADLAGLKQAAQDVTESARRFAPQARIDGILIQQMASGTEAIVGAVDDPHFGPTVLFGLGGILSEVLHDVTHRFAPFDLDTAREMVREIRAAALFDGYRGKPALDVEALADALMRVSLLIADHAGAIREIDINPLFVRPVGQGVLAADALIVLHEPTVRPDPS